MKDSFIFMIQQEFKNYDQQKFFKDLLAGITVAAVALPLALAFGVSSGATASSGLITAVIAGFIISFFSGGFYQISGPTGAMAAILISIIATKQMTGVFIATFLAGILLILAGIFNLGKLTSLIPGSVIIGFTSGIAIIIALGQVDNFFGVSSEGRSIIEKFTSYQKLGFAPNSSAMIIGISIILLMAFFPKKWNTFIPASLIGILIATMITINFKIKVPTVGAIPTTLFPKERLHLTEISFQNIKELFAPAFSIAILGMIESLLCGASASRMTNKSLDSNQELVAQGIGNLILPFFGGIPATAAIARTSVAIKSGAQTRLTGIIHAIVLLLSMFLLAPLMSRIPLSALAGVLMVTAFRMNDWSEIRSLFSLKLTSGITKFLITMAATVILDLSTAILIGIAVGLIFFIAKSAAVEISIVDVHPEKIGKPVSALADSWSVIYLTGPLFFMNVEAVKEKLTQDGTKNNLVLSMRGVPNIDLTSVKMLLDFYQNQTENNR